LSPCDELVVIWSADLDLPELLAPALVDRGGDHVQSPPNVGAQEVGHVAVADRLLAAVLDRLIRTESGERLNSGGVEAAVHEPQG
jgi:hypothetical protein